MGKLLLICEYKSSTQMSSLRMIIRKLLYSIKAFKNNLKPFQLQTKIKSILKINFQLYFNFVRYLLLSSSDK